MRSPPNTVTPARSLHRTHIQSPMNAPVIFPEYPGSAEPYGTKPRSARSRFEITVDLRQAINQGIYMPNQRLVESDLAATFRCSRPAVRLALAMLEQEGLVTREPLRGARVRLIGDQEVREIVLTLSAFEALLAAQAASRGSADQRKTLMRAFSEMREAHKRKDVGKLFQQNTAIHAFIWTMAGNKTVNRLMEGLQHTFVRFQYCAVLMPGRDSALLSEHENLVTAICKKEPTGAEIAMKRHFEGILISLEDALKLKCSTS
jgi:DNA-binding GntR family transcriptional regulator